jgi:hypothetical protein
VPTRDTHRIMVSSKFRLVSANYRHKKPRAVAGLN